MSKSGDIEQSRLGSAIDKERKGDGVSDGASFIECSIHVPGYQGCLQFSYWKIEPSGEVLVDKDSSGPTVDQGTGVNDFLCTFTE